MTGYITQSWVKGNFPPGNNPNKLHFIQHLLSEEKSASKVNQLVLDMIKIDKDITGNPNKKNIEATMQQQRDIFKELAENAHERKVIYLSTPNTRILIIKNHDNVDLVLILSTPTTRKNWIEKDYWLQGETNVPHEFGCI